MLFEHESGNLTVDPRFLGGGVESVECGGDGSSPRRAINTKAAQEFQALIFHYQGAAGDAMGHILPQFMLLRR
jgi:hypothetical protein